MLKMFLWDIQTYKIRPELDLGEGGLVGWENGVKG